MEGIGHIPIHMEYVLGETIQLFKIRIKSRWEKSVFVIDGYIVEERINEH